MNNNKTTNILLGILIVVLVAIGIIMATNQNRNTYPNDLVQNKDSMMNNQNNTNKDDFPVIDNQKDIPEPVKTNSNQQVSTTTNSKNINWSSVSTSTIENLIKKTEFPLEGKPTLSTETQDLTGDGIKEGIYGLPSGNAGLTIVAMTNADGSVSLARMKKKDGSIGIVGFYSVGSASYSISYKFLPNERGFYEVSKNIDENADNSESSHLICGSNGILAYQWNPTTSLFEYNSALTAKYTAIECK